MRKRTRPYRTEEPESPPPPPSALEAEIALGQVIYDNHGMRGIVKLGSGRIVKYGGAAPSQEAAVLRYVSQRTTIPVPGNVEVVAEEAKRTYLLMDHVNGEPLSKAWPDLSSDDRTTILTELKAYIEQLRSLRNHDADGYIGSLNRGRCTDGRVPGNPFCGPFDTEALFNDHIALNMASSLTPEPQRRFLRSLMKDDHEIVFTHGDMHPSNILVKDGHVVAILDWEMAGWYPEHWEWCKALFLDRWELDGWYGGLKDWLRPYDLEYGIDRLLLAHSRVWL